MEIYTDGGVMHNGHAHAYGSWAFASSCGIVERAGIVEPNATVAVTNNRTELMAAIEAIKWCHGRVRAVSIVTDSQLTMMCGRRSWRRKANLDLWEEFDRQAGGLIVDWRWVHGHRGDPMNERVDTMCTNLMREYAAGALQLPQQPESPPRPTIDSARTEGEVLVWIPPLDNALDWPAIVDPFAGHPVARVPAVHPVPDLPTA